MFRITAVQQYSKAPVIVFETIFHIRPYKKPLKSFVHRKGAYTHAYSKEVWGAHSLHTHRDDHNNRGRAPSPLRTHATFLKTLKRKKKSSIDIRAPVNDLCSCGFAVSFDISLSVTFICVFQFSFGVFLIICDVFKGSQFNYRELLLQIIILL